MSALRALRLLQRGTIARTPAGSFVPTHRTYASRPAEPRPADDAKPALRAEEASEDLSGDDPNMNGNYPDPNLTSALPLKRQFRDPYGDWWDKQERRNYGEPVHEDNDILGIFSPEAYTWTTPAKGALMWASFLGAAAVVLGVVYRQYPDKPSVPRAYPGGLDRELGGPGSVPARKSSEEDSVL